MDAAAAYQVVARRYRPQRFDELIGQEHVARGLAGAIEQGRIGHAYLFTGARGVGKTSAARIFAKALQCSSGPAAEPCNVCDPCRDIAAGHDVDVVEIDAASNRGVDEIRQLRQNVAVRPARGRFKVYIIDEVHMLTREAFNALLKTLEEPPGHVKFVLCTTEPDKLPITILSRCQRFDFTIVAPGPIARRLAQIVEAEGADVAPAALDLIARRAAGSMRDSQSLLEQLLGSTTGHVGIDEVHALIGTGREERIGEIVGAIARRDAPAALAALDAAVHAGADPGGVLDQLVAALRDCLLASVGCESDLLGQPAGHGVDLAAIGSSLGTATTLAMLQILDQSLARMNVSSHADVLAEMAIVRLATLEDLDSLAATLERVSHEPSTPPPSAPRQPARQPQARAPQNPTPPANPAAQTTPATADEDHATQLQDVATKNQDQDDATSGLREHPGSGLREHPVSGLREKKTAKMMMPTAVAAPDDEPAATAGPPTPAKSQAALMREASAHPFVARAVSLFDASIRRVDRRPPRAQPVTAPRADPAPADGGDVAEGVADEP
jgi:DNA polymerase-3 subunit gamma/tau